MKVNNLNIANLYSNRWNVSFAQSEDKNKKPEPFEDYSSSKYFSIYKPDKNSDKNLPSLINGFVKNSSVKKIETIKYKNPDDYKNNLRTLFQENKAIIYAMVPRTFNAKNLNKTDLIDGNDKQGTFLNAIDRLDEMKNLGINTFQVLPINPPGKIEAKGNAGSLYAPKDYLEIDPALDDKSDLRSVKEEMKEFIKECHKRDMKVMLDMPSCMSIDLYVNRPDLRAEDALGNPETPQGWEDIRMFDPWEDKDKKVLNPNLLDMHKKYIDMCIDLGVDGIRADVARAKPVEFWDVIIPYARSKDPEFGFLAETYTYEDASPMLNMTHDRPDDLLRAGFDSVYGQYHIFNFWKAKDFHKFIAESLDSIDKIGGNKSLIGSFATHDDPSPMANGGVDYCKLTNVLQATVPKTNPYIITGFESGDRYVYNHPMDKLPNGDRKYYVHDEFLDIFNLSRKPEGKNPEIGTHFKQLMDFRKKYEGVITKGSYIPIEVEGSKNDDVIAFERKYNDKTLLVVANKDANSREKVNIKVKGLKSNQNLIDLTPNYGEKSFFIAGENELIADLGPARAHVFEINS